VTLQSDLGTVVKTGETMTRFELGREEFLALLTPEQEALLGERYVVSSLITVPLRARGEVIGAANIARTLPGASRYTEADRVFLEELADRAAVAIDNARLFAQANASQQRFRALLDSSRIGFVARDADGRVVETNQAYAAMMGYDHREELYGTTPDAVIHEDARDEAVATFAQAFSGAADRIEVERDYVRRDGSVMHARVSTSLLRDEHGDPLYALSIVEDVGRQRSLELQLRESQKMDALGRFAGAIAHDFNNVLTAIAGFNELIAADLGPDHPLHGETAEIAAAAEHAAGLTRQLLTFSRHQVVAAEVLSVGDLVQDLAPMLARLLGEDVELAVAVTDAPSAVRADRNQLEQVMVNLVVNARDAMPHGGRLTIGVDLTEIDEEGAGSRLAVDPGTYVRLAVSDTGHGIDDETQRRMFEPFFTTKAPDKGTGLGLSTVFGIIEQSGGSVAVYSEPGHGTTMRVYLPYTQERAPVADEAPPARTPRRSPAEATVLVVDDEPSVRLVVMRILERDGYTVLTAGDGDEALEIARTHPGQIDVMITDVVLPGLQGPEIAERLHELRPDTGILYSSGYPGDEIVRRGIDPDASYIEKPFSHDALLAAVADLLAGA
jgi:PAS domain S-box-containing protein